MGASAGRTEEDDRVARRPDSPENFAPPSGRGALRPAEEPAGHLVDTDPELARVLHRVVWGMHDGECPSCHALFEAGLMRGGGLGADLRCPACGFAITAAEQAAAVRAFAPVMERNLAAFEEWRDKL